MNLLTYKIIRRKETTSIAHSCRLSSGTEESMYSKPPINPNMNSGGKPSDHLVVLMYPLVSELQIPPRVYTTVTTRPLTQSGIERFAEWVEHYPFSEIYECKDANRMAENFQNILVDNYRRCFPTKSFRVCQEDRPWVSAELKTLHRRVKREYYKNKKSEKWSILNKEYLERCLLEKEKYYQNIVADLKTSNPSKWYSKVKRMCGQSDSNQVTSIDELIGLSDQEQSERIAEHYSLISNQYDQVRESDFIQYFNPTRHGVSAPPQIEPLKVYKVIEKMNKKAATIENDIPIKLFHEFSVELAFPPSHIINFCIQNGVFPELWKVEIVTPVPRIHPRRNWRT